MNETYVTFQGWLGSDVSERQVGEAVVATFRVASTPRRWSRRDRTWADGDTTWYTVNAWRGLGEHCIASLRRSDPVVVTGRLTTQVWRDNDGSERLSLLVEAVSVGHDLAKGTSTFTKAPRPAEREEADDSALRELNASFGVGGPQVSSLDGEAIEEDKRQDPAA